MASDPTSEVIRGRNYKNRYFTHFEGRTSISTINQRLFEAIAAMEAIEATEVVKTTVTLALWAMEAKL